MTVHDPETCRCINCVAADILLQTDPRIILSQKDFFMHQKPSTVEIGVIRGKAKMPVYLSLFHHFFEKSCPAVVSDKAAVLTAPIDQLDMIMKDAPDNLLNQIESIDIFYMK